MQIKIQTAKNSSLSNRPFVRIALLLVVTSAFFCRPASLLGENDKDKDLRKHYGLIFGTAYGPDDRPLYGAKIQIHPVGQKHPHWELMSDHRGEFALRVPPGPADYLVTGEAEMLPTQNAESRKKMKIKAERTVHIQAEERQDIGLHLAQ